MNQLGCVLVFREGLSKEDAVRALNSISHVLQLPATTYGTEDTGQRTQYGQKVVRSVTRPFRMADKIHEFNPEHGGPVWYIP